MESVWLTILGIVQAVTVVLASIGFKLFWSIIVDLKEEIKTLKRNEERLETRVNAQEVAMTKLNTQFEETNKSIDASLGLIKIGLEQSNSQMQQFSDKFGFVLEKLKREDEKR